MIRIALALLMCVTLTACQTMDRMGAGLAGLTDMDLTGGERISVIPQEGCPSVSRVAELSSLYQFTDPGDPDDKEKIVEAHIVKVASKCTRVGGNLKLDLAIDIDAGLGKKGRARAGDKPAFAFPYFVAIMDAQNKILSKEIFAVSFNFDAKTNTQSQIETLTQMVPMAGGNPGAYRVMMGFQLAADELAYNRKLPVEQLGKDLP